MLKLLNKKKKEVIRTGKIRLFEDPPKTEKIYLGENQITTEQNHTYSEIQIKFEKDAAKKIFEHLQIIKAKTEKIDGIFFVNSLTIENGEKYRQCYIDPKRNDDQTFDIEFNMNKNNIVETASLLTRKRLYAYREGETPFIYRKVPIEKFQIITNYLLPQIEKEVKY